MKLPTFMTRNDWLILRTDFSILQESFNQILLFQHVYIYNIFTKGQSYGHTLK